MQAANKSGEEKNKKGKEAPPPAASSAAAVAAAAAATQSASSAASAAAAVAQPPNQTTDYEYALFCIMSSHREKAVLKKLDDKEFRKHKKREKWLLDGCWKPLQTSEELGVRAHDYYGVSYYRLDEDSKQVEVVVAHRGTRVNEGNIRADIDIAEIADVAIASDDTLRPKILREAVFEYMGQLFPKSNFYTSAGATKDFSIGDYPVTRITHVGFSLGGFIAASSVALSRSPTMHAVTFDAPGIEGLRFADAKRGERIINYVTTPNFVNTCNKHVGMVRQITSFKAVDAKQQDEVCFVLDVTKLGFFTKNTTYFDSYYDLEGKARKQARKDNGKKSQLLANNSMALDEIKSTAESHNLELIISRMEESGSAELKSEPVHTWPTATNKLIRKRQEELKGDADLHLNDIWSAVASLVVSSGQTYLAARLWGITRTLDEDGRAVGIVGAEHKRTNKVRYSKMEDDAYIAEQKQQEATKQQLKEKLQQLQKHISKLLEENQAEQVAAFFPERLPELHMQLLHEQINLEALEYKLELALENVHTSLRVFSKLAEDFRILLEGCCKRLGGNNTNHIYHVCLRLMVEANAPLPAPMQSKSDAGKESKEKRADTASSSSSSASSAAVASMDRDTVTTVAVSSNSSTLVEELSLLTYRRDVLQTRMAGTHSAGEEKEYNNILERVRKLEMTLQQFASMPAAFRASSSSSSSSSAAASAAAAASVGASVATLVGAAGGTSPAHTAGAAASASASSASASASSAAAQTTSASSSSSSSSAGTAQPAAIAPVNKK